MMRAMIGRVAVTGATGRLGSALLARMVDCGEIESIVAIDRRAPTHPRPGVHYVAADVRDPDIGRLFDGSAALVHLAFIVERGSRDPALVQSVNVDGTRNVVTAAI